MGVGLVWVSGFRVSEAVWFVSALGCLGFVRGGGVLSRGVGASAIGLEGVRAFRVKGLGSRVQLNHSLNPKP